MNFEEVEKSLNIAKIYADIEKTSAETARIQSEIYKQQSEMDKLRAETLKTQKETQFYPLITVSIAVIALLGVVVGALLNKLL